MSNNKKGNGKVRIIKEQNSYTGHYRSSTTGKSVRPPRPEHNPIETRRSDVQSPKILIKKK